MGINWGHPLASVPNSWPGVGSAPLGSGLVLPDAEAPKVWLFHGKLLDVERISTSVQPKPRVQARPLV